MLTADLVKASVRRGVVLPHYIDTEDPELLELAGCLADRFTEHRGKRRRELQSCLDDILGAGTEYLLHRGLAKLLYDRCEFETDSPIEPEELRRAVFEAAAVARVEGPPDRAFDRAAVFAGLADRFPLAREELERCLYADLKEEQTLVDFRGVSPARLLRRYNVALAQAALLRAEALDIRISRQSPRRYRELFRTIKFFQLLHSVTGTAREGYRIRLDGPFSLFTSSQRYGVQMANFLPTLIRFDHWKLEAVVRWGAKRVRRRFHITSESGLESDRDLRGQWQPDEMTWLEQQFAKLESDWTVSSEAELIDLGGQGVLVPDYVFVHGPTGRRVFMEIFGYRRRGAVASRLELLRKHGPADLIVAISKELRTEDDALEGLPGEVYVFRNQPIAREVLALLESVLTA